MLKTVSFWNGDRKLAALHYYATHPMSFYAMGMVTSDFAGLAREQRTREDGVPPHLLHRLRRQRHGREIQRWEPGKPRATDTAHHAGMVESEKQARRIPLTTIEWRAEAVLLAPDLEFSEERMIEGRGERENRALPPHHRGPACGLHSPMRRACADPVHESAFG